MRTISSLWEANQAKTVSDPGRLSAFVETYGGDPEVSTRVEITNDPGLNNVQSATVVSVLDPTSVTFPIESCVLVVTNGDLGIS